MVTKIQNVMELTGLTLFSEMTADELEEIARVTFIKKYAAGQLIFAEGMSGEIMYVVLSGEVEIFKFKGDKEITIARLGVGEFIGEGSLVLDGHRSTSCRISENAELLVITKKSFQDLARSHPAITTKLLEQFLKTSIMRLRSTNKVTG